MPDTSNAGEAARFSRRFLLRRTLVGAGVMTFGGLVFTGWPRRAMRSPAGPFKTFSPDEAAILTAVGETFLPAAPGFPSVQDARVVERIDERLAAMDAVDADEFKTLLFVFEYGAPLVGPALGRFTALSDTARESYLAGWEHSRFEFKRTGFHALKYLIFLFYYDTPASWKKLKYAGPLLPRMGEG